MAHSVQIVNDIR